MRVLSIDDLRFAKGIVYSRAHLYRLIKAGAFPKPIKLGSNRIAFVESEIDHFLNEKIRERNANQGAVDAKITQKRS